MQVVLTRSALLDLDDIAAWISRDDPRRARSFVAELRLKCAELGAHPLAHPVLRQDPQGLTRRRVHGSYLIFYEVHDDAVYVTHVVHGARDYGRLVFGED